MVLSLNTYLPILEIRKINLLELHTNGPQIMSDPPSEASRTHHTTGLFLGTL